MFTPKPLPPFLDPPKVALTETPNEVLGYILDTQRCVMALQDAYIEALKEIEKHESNRPD